MNHDLGERVFAFATIKSVDGRCCSAATMPQSVPLQSQTLGAILNGCIEGRKSGEEITVFDSSGVAVQDIAAAQAALDIVTAALAENAEA